MYRVVGALCTRRTRWCGYPATHALEHVLADQRFVRQVDRVHAVEARSAEPARRLLRGRDEAVKRHIPKGVGADGTADSVLVEVARDQLGARGEVDAVEAR